MQVGIIMLGGRQIGVIMQGQESIDTTTPMISDGGPSGNSMLGDDMPEAHDDHEHGAPSGVRRRSRRGSERSAERRERKPTAQSSDGMDAYGDGDGGKSRAKEKDETRYDIAKGNPFDRSRFERELAEKPWLREKIKRLSLGENKDRTANLAVIESMMNRAAVRGTSLEQQAKRHAQSGLDERGYYAGYAKSYNPDQGAMADRNIDKALQGSNVTDYATDNSSGDLARRTKVNGRFNHHKDFGGKGNWESFWSPGNAEPAFRNKWQQMRKGVDKYNNPDPSVDGIAPPSMGKASDKTSSIPAKVQVASAKENWIPSDAFNPAVEERKFESDAEQITPPFPRSDEKKPEPLKLDPKDKNPSGIYPPTPGDGSKENDFSIPQDYNLT